MSAATSHRRNEGGRGEAGERKEGRRREGGGKKEERRREERERKEIQGQSMHDEQVDVHCVVTPLAAQATEGGRSHPLSSDERG